MLTHNLPPKVLLDLHYNLWPAAISRKDKNEGASPMMNLPFPSDIRFLRPSTFFSTPSNETLLIVGAVCLILSTEH